MPELGTRGTECGLLPTPTAWDATRKIHMEKGAFMTSTGTVRRRNRNGTTSNLGLAGMMYPTPTARDWKDSPGMNTGTVAGGRKRDDLLPRRVYAMGETGGALNPDWVEWLMGWPIGLSSMDAGCSGEILGWDQEPDIPRVAKGVKDRVARLKAIGNGQVPAVVRLAWEQLTTGAAR